MKNLDQSSTFFDDTTLSQKFNMITKRYKKYGASWTYKNFQ